MPSAHATAFLANLSASYALFEADGELLRPVELRRLDRYDDDLITIQKYLRLRAALAARRREAGEPQVGRERRDDLRADRRYRPTTTNWS